MNAYLLTRKISNQGRRSSDRWPVKGKYVNWWGWAMLAGLVLGWGSLYLIVFVLAGAFK